MIRTENYVRHWKRKILKKFGSITIAATRPNLKKKYPSANINKTQENEESDLGRDSESLRTALILW